jgi:hypothetical protein
VPENKKELQLPLKGNAALYLAFVSEAELSLTMNERQAVV